MASQFSLGGRFLTPSPGGLCSHNYFQKGGALIQYQDYRYEISKEFHSIYAMQVRRLGYETGAIYSEDHDRPVLTKGDKSVIFCLNLYNTNDADIHEYKDSPINKRVYVFQWGVTSLFHYNDFRRLTRHFFPDKPANSIRFQPVFELPQDLCDELLTKQTLKLDGNLERSNEFHFFYWFIDKGHGLFNLCLNTYFDALLFLPVRIVVKETGKVLRW